MSQKYPVWQQYVTDSSGNTISGATVEVRRESDDGLATLYNTPAHTTSIDNPFNATGAGLARFYVIDGTYKITITSGSYSATLRNVLIGTPAGAETDFVRLPTYANLAAITAAITSPDAGMCVFVTGQGPAVYKPSTGWVLMADYSTAVT